MLTIRKLKIGPANDRTHLCHGVTFYRLVTPKNGGATLEGAYCYTVGIKLKMRDRDLIVMPSQVNRLQRIPQDSR